MYKAVNTHSVPEQMQALENQLTNQHAEVRITAAAALRRLATPEALAASTSPIIRELTGTVFARMGWSSCGR